VTNDWQACQSSRRRRDIRGAFVQPIIGRVEFSGVLFAMRIRVVRTRCVSFTIPEGSIFGHHGAKRLWQDHSYRLLQLFYSSYEGLIKIDAPICANLTSRICVAVSAWCRRENFLFSGTIHETISSGKPDAQLR